MFFEPLEIPGIAILRREWRVIRAEFDAARDGRFAPWKERHIYEGDWDTLFLFDGYKGKAARRLADNCAAFPETARLLAAVPGVLSAGFSRLGPHTRIVSHRGFDPHVVRVHLGIKVPWGCWLAVRWERRFWAEGDLLTFDDTRIHMVENPSGEERIVLILDIDMKRQPAKVLSRRHMPITIPDLMRYPVMVADLARRRLARAIGKRAHKIGRFARYRR